MIIGRKPKLSAEQQEELRRWYTERAMTRREKARQLGIAESTLTRYLNGGLKRPIRCS